MKRPTTLAFAIFPVLALAAAAPLAAQDGNGDASQAAAQDDNGDVGQTGPVDNPNEKINQLIVYGDDKCPQSKDSEIVVCARKPESERYRIPKDLRTEPGPDTQAWTNRVESYEFVGNFGTLSCSPAGYGGWSGCTQALIDAAYQEKKTGKAVLFSELIAKERAKRLSKIDEEAAAEQKRVEKEEKEYAASHGADAGQAGDDSNPVTGN